MAFRSWIVGNDGNTDTTLQPITFVVPNNPSIAQVGDVAVVTLSINSSGGSPFTAPSGWTYRGPGNQDANLAGGFGTGLYTKTLTSTEVGHSVVFNADYAGRTVGGMMIHSGVTEASIVVDLGQHQTGSATTAIPFGAPTTGSTPASWDVATIGVFRRAAANPAGVATTPSGWTLDGDSQTNFGGSPNFTAFGFHLTAGGAASTTYGSGVSAAADTAGFSNAYTYAFPVTSTSYVKTITDSSTSTDAVSFTQALARTQADSSTSTDAVVAGQGLTRTQADSSTSTDAVKVAQGRAPVEQSTSTDALTVVQSMSRTIAEVSVSHDTVNAVLIRPDINDHEFVIPIIPWVPFGHSQTIDVNSFDPGSFTIASQDVSSPAGDYMLFGTDRHTPPLWSWSLYTNVFNETDARAWADSLKQVWNNAIRLAPEGVVPLRYRVNGVVRKVYGRPRKFGLNLERIQHGKIRIVCDFQLAEDIYYDDTDLSVTVPITGAPAQKAGVILPQPLPWVFTTPPAARTAQAIVNGSAKTWLDVFFHGPVTNPTVQIGDRTYGLIGTVPLGMTARLSGRPWESGVVIYSNSPDDGTWHPEMLDPRAILSELQVDPNVWYGVIYTGFDNTGTSTCNVSWATAYESF